MNHTYNISDPLNLTSSAIILALGIFGIVCNAMVIYVFFKIRIERTSFNFICVCRAVCNIFILVWGFLGTFLPITFLNDLLFSFEYHTIVIGSCNSVYKSLQYSGLLIAVNRFCAIFLSVLYAKIFNLKFTIIITFIVFGYEIAKVIYEFITFVIRLKCYLIFFPYDLAWVPRIPEECHDGIEGTVNFTAIFLALIVAINLATFSKIYLFYKSTEMDSEEIRIRIYPDDVQRTIVSSQETFVLYVFYSFYSFHCNSYQNVCDGILVIRIIPLFLI
ncbi:Protein CBG27049 [Caenorhabditis briggsae]|uniref:Protein CBG27049 n=1 Tax=Caenorhabditis briggsae TaxID=6238 RepID=B6IMB3_CAEBR|nr:Protein CBG27049 [Caenorhabditis briggsae]CAS01043.1 Protein CBG27049 [Caenorhabditis briggsae]